MYISPISVTTLKAFIDGYKAAKPNSELVSVLVEFQKFLQDKFSLGENHSWNRIILLYSSDERNSFDSFNFEFDQFLKKRE